VVALEALSFTGDGLCVPESVLCTASGEVFATNRRCGVSQIRSDGTVRHIGDAAFVAEREIVPNGIALLADGTFLIADTGVHGGVWRLTAEGAFSPFLLEIEGHSIPSTNFVMVDDRARVWITISTRALPRERAFSPAIADGFIAVLEDGRARIVAEGLQFANELRVDPAGEHLYVNETFAERVTRFRIAKSGLGERETYVQLPRGSFTEGLAFDEDGGLWVTCIVSNRLFRIAPDRSATLVLEDLEPAALVRTVATFDEDRFTRSDMERPSARILPNISSIAFGGNDRRTAYLGSTATAIITPTDTMRPDERTLTYVASIHKYGQSPSIGRSRKP
jgi:sugar lactone lactonase YvrE